MTILSTWSISDGEVRRATESKACRAARLEVQREIDRKRRDRRRAFGLCWDCNAQAQPGKSRCVACSVAKAAYMRLGRRRK